MTAGKNSSDTAMMRPMFAVTEPIALPMAMSVLPSAAAIVDTMISGSVVATETIVAPIRNFGMPDASAIQAAASTNQSPPLMISTNPTRNRKIVSAKLISNTPSFSNVGVKGIKKTFCTPRCKKSRSCGVQAQAHRQNTGRLLTLRL